MFQVLAPRLHRASQTHNSTVSVRSILILNESGGASVSEAGQILCGQSSGVTLCTNTAHPIRLTTYYGESVVGGVFESMQILATGTRDVEIFAPLKIKSSQTTIDKGV